MAAIGRLEVPPSVPPVESKVSQFVDTAAIHVWVTRLRFVMEKVVELKGPPTGPPSI